MSQINIEDISSIEIKFVDILIDWIISKFKTSIGSIFKTPCRTIFCEFRVINLNLCFVLNVFLKSQGLLYWISVDP
jgi:hypothetical protein